MSEMYRRYRAIKQGLMQFYQPRPTGHRERLIQKTGNVADWLKNNIPHPLR